MFKVVDKSQVFPEIRKLDQQIMAKWQNVNETKKPRKTAIEEKNTRKFGNANPPAPPP